MNQSFGLSCRPTQSLCHTIKLGLSQSLAHTVGMTRPPGSPGNPEEILRRILANIADSICNPKLKTAVTALISEKALLKAFLSHKESLAVLRAGRIEDFAAGHIYSMSTQDGKFVHMTDAEGHLLPEPPKTSRTFFTEALLAPEVFVKKVTENEEMIRAVTKNVGDAAIEEHSEMVAATRVAEQVRPLFENFTALLQLIFAKKAEGEVTVAQFLRDATILEKLDLIMSERLIGRFLKRFRRIGPNAQAAYFEEAMLNTVAEYTLISMGVISPEIFALQRGHVASEAYEAAGEELEKVGISLTSVLEHYNLKASGSLFWYRYSTTKVIPSNRSEQAVRGFITDTVRKDRVEILKAINYERLFVSLKEAKVSSPEEFSDSATEALTAELGSDVFQGKYLALLRKWYPKLEALL